MKEFIKVSSVKTTGIRAVPYQFDSQTHCFSGTPECKLKNPFYGLKTHTFSCMGGIL